MASIYLNPGKHTWMMEFRDIHGKRVRESTGTTNKQQAKKIADARETDKDRGLPIAAGVGKITWSAAVQLFEADYIANNFTSLANQQIRLRLHLTPAFGDYRMAEISAELIAAYITRRREEEEASIGQVNRELDLLRRMFVICVNLGRLLYRPHIPRLRERNARAGFFERPAFEAVCAHLPAPLAAAMQFAYITGWRVNSEVLTRQWRHVDFEANEVRLEPGETKNGEPRVFQLTAELRALLEERAAIRDRCAAAGFVCPWVFFRTYNTTRRRGIKHANPPQRPKPIANYKDAWRAACLAAGVPGRIPHDLRRTAVRNMVRRGVLERVAMRLAGHLTRTVFDRYNIVSAADLIEATARLEGLIPESTLRRKPTHSPTPEAIQGARPGEIVKKARKFGRG